MQGLQASDAAMVLNPVVEQGGCAADCAFQTDPFDGYGHHTCVCVLTRLS